jgi:hypothetical protein
MERDSDVGIFKAILIGSRIIAWAIVGAFLVASLVLVVCYLYNLAVPDKGGDEYRAWIQFVLLMLSPWPGVLAGAIFGAARATRK